MHCYKETYFIIIKGLIKTCCNEYFDKARSFETNLLLLLFYYFFIFIILVSFESTVLLRKEMEQYVARLVN